MPRLLIIGIDALDSEILTKFEDELPNLKKFREESPKINLESVFPPDTPTAWASIFTGLNPAKHGVLFFVDPLDKISTYANVEIDNTTIRRRTFWDFACTQGKRACILFPRLGYPVWPINGVLIGKAYQWYEDKPPIEAYPPSVSEEYDLTPLAPVKALIHKKYLPKYIDEYRHLVSEEAALGLKLLKREDWDLFFIYSIALDWLGHNLWSYFDEEDPLYPGPNPYEDVIPEFYRFYDGMIGKLMSEVGTKTSIIVFSDHGFGRRPLKLININEILRRRGLLVPKIRRTSVQDPYYLIEFLKKELVKFVSRRGAGKVITRIVHAMPCLRELYTSPPSIDWEKTIAYISDLSGLKAYDYGGIIINKQNIKGKSYEEIRSSIIEELRVIKENGSDANIVKWICRREDLYDGPYISRYPDVLFLLREDFGGGWAIFDSIFGGTQTHNIHPGSHKIDSPIFFIKNVKEKSPMRKKMKLMDIAPTILDLLEVKGDFKFDGKSIFKA